MTHPPIPPTLAEYLLDLYADRHAARQPRFERRWCRPDQPPVAEVDAAWRAGLRAAQALGYAAWPDSIGGYLLDRLADDPPPPPHTPQRHDWTRRHTEALQQRFTTTTPTTDAVVDGACYRVRFLDEDDDTDCVHVGVRDAATGLWRIRGIARWTYHDDELHVLGPAPVSATTPDTDAVVETDNYRQWAYTIYNEDQGEHGQYPTINGQRTDGQDVLAYLCENDGNGRLTMFVRISDAVDLTIVEADESTGTLTLIRRDSTGRR